MDFEWTRDLSTSVEQIDKDHKEIFRRLSDLNAACREGKGRKEISGMIKFLSEYVLAHFELEEKYMQNYNYPDYNAHKSQHVSFIKTVVDLKKELDREGPSISLVIKTNFDIADWLKNHIRQVDKSLGEYLKTRVNG